jgi:anti-sigma-K factor RskA
MSEFLDSPDDDLEALAGEYCLGLLTPVEAAAAALRVDTDAAFAAAVEGWTVRLMPLVDDLPEVAPPAGLWASLAARTAPPPRAARGWFASWRGYALGAGLAAVAAVLFVTLRPAPPTRFAVATLVSAADGTFVATAERQGADIHLIVDPKSVILPAGRVAELWVIAPGAAPKPLGLLAGDHAVDVAYNGAALNQVALAVSIEPPGGSPTGLPTGPVIASAKFSSL